MSIRYTAYLSAQAVDFFMTLRRAERVALVRMFERVACRPGGKGDYQERDDEGRVIEVTVVGKLAVLFWADHAVARVMVVEIRPANRRS